MNVWKPIALCATTALVASLGIQVASANTSSSPNPTLQGPCFDQPNMAGAKDKLREALAFLNKAEHNKGGWRDKAIASTNEALAQTTAGCNFANDHK